MSSNSSSSGKAEALVYDTYGQPLDVLRLKEVEMAADLGEKDVRFRTLAAPINPSDINQIQGVYPVRPAMPAVGGNEGVAEVVDVGAGVTTLRQGDWVIPLHSGSGTWRTMGVTGEDKLIKVSNKMSMEAAATIAVNPCTAFRMLSDFATLEPGDSIIQNGANSGVGVAVIQLCKAWGIASINVIRQREGADDVKKELTELGATLVVTDKDLEKSTTMEEYIKERGLAAPTLAFNCIGGASARDMCRYLKHAGTLVTYGAMSREPMNFSAASFIFNDLRCRGFWMTAWSKKAAMSERRIMLDALADMYAQNKLKCPAMTAIDFRDFQRGFKNLETPGAGKQLLLFDKR